MPEAEEGEKLVGNIPDGSEIVKKAEQTYLTGSERLGGLKNVLLAYGVLAAFFLTGCTSPLKEDYRISFPQPGAIATETLAPTPTVTKRPYAISEVEVRATHEARGPAIRATDTARTKDSLAVELEELPQNIVRSSAMIAAVSKEGNLYKSGTATFIEHIPGLNIYLVLTARHVLEREDGQKIDLLLFRQPHRGIDFATEKFTIATISRKPDADIVLIALIAPPLPTPMGVLGPENLQFDWVPKEGDELFSLPFPGDAPMHELHPIKFKPMTDEIAKNQYRAHGKIFTTGLSGMGASGAGVVNKEGRFIGIITGSTYIGSNIQPLSAINYQELWNKALGELLERFLVKGEEANK